GSGGTGGIGGTVNVTNNGLLSTQGDGAYGIQAQSIGGGGGVGGRANSLAFALGAACGLPVCPSPGGGTNVNIAISVGGN
ncbi:hypothetical protein ACQ1Z2_16320, partial [Enterococcus faecalis]|uniref:hypothetical protein n=1 Tax=Enterococcus faecalis TaxID=1351 RepID=UPI003D6A882A